MKCNKNEIKNEIKYGIKKEEYYEICDCTWRWNG